MAKSSAKSKVPRRKKKLKIRRRKVQAEKIVIDKEQGLVFDTEKELFAHFQPQIDRLEEDYQKFHKANDTIEDKIKDLEQQLDLTLDQPAEIWHDNKSFKEFPIFHFIRPLEDHNAFHVAVTYVSDEDVPTFIFLHFATQDIDLVNQFRRGDLVYDRSFEEVEFGAISGDSLSEGDPLSVGLFISMLKVRSDTDVPHDQFQKLGEELREETIERADEIWRSQDLHGNVVVTFIKEFTDHEIKNLYYVAVTVEDQSSAVHTLLFSFPTNDENLVDRYRQGENLQAEEVVQESSH